MSTDQGTPNAVIEAAPFVESQFDGVLSRRFVGHMADWLILLLFTLLAGFVSAALSIVTFGLLSVPLALAWALLPFAYFTYFTGGPASATPGMRMMGVELRDISGTRPNFVQTGIRTFLFMVSMSVFAPIILWVFFNPRRRAVHDILTSSVVVRRREST
jgi:uncharacterized RDD family membrane protein YckC